MFVLQVNSGPSKGQVIELVFGVTLQIGRSRSCTIHFDSLEVSGRHAAVRWDDDGFSVSDLGSRNGTFVNGAQISGRTGVRLGDFIQVGTEILQLKEMAATADGQVVSDEGDGRPGKTRKILAFDTRATMVGESLDKLKAQMAVESAPPSDSSHTLPPDPKPPVRARPQLLSAGAQQTAMLSAPLASMLEVDAVRGAADLASILASPSAGRSKVIVRVLGRLDHFATLPITLGRENQSGVVLDDPGASLAHAVIDHRNGAFVVRDVGSTNGTYINGQRVVVQTLHNGDVITIGKYHLLAVIEGERLGLEVSTPGVMSLEESGGFSHSSMGIIDNPLGDESGGRKRKKKASELVWFATSDLDRGVFRARSALIGLLLGSAATTWMLAQGNSEVLAGGKLMAVHEGAEFDGDAQRFGRGGCTACHVGAGRVSILKCFDCHEQMRPNDDHAGADLSCAECHFDHRGDRFKSGASAAMSCKKCHLEPHEKLLRLEPKLVAGFRRDAPGDVAFHQTHYDDNAILCSTCHAEAVVSSKGGIRSVCGGCHAPDNAAAEECHQCHRLHPDRSGDVDLAEVPPQPAARFPMLAGGVVFGLVVLPFFAAALIPRKRKVNIGGDAEADEIERRPSTRAK